MNNQCTKFDAVIQTPVARLGILFAGELLLSVEYLKPDQSLKKPVENHVSNLAEQIAEYFNNPVYQFKLNLKPKGTVFQQRVWQEMLRIAPGKVITYGEMADRLSTSPRAVGNACRANPIPLIIPCHRVVSASGLGGFAGARSGYFTDIKRQLLLHEGLEF